MAPKPAQKTDKQSYLFTGPVTPLILADGKERLLFPGTSYTDLPIDLPQVANLIDAKRLVPEIGNLPEAQSLAMEGEA